MPVEPLNREIPPSRPPGRPPANTPRQPEHPAVVATTTRHLPPLHCPKCLGGDQHKLERWLPDGTAACLCVLCGRRFIYTPATVRAK